LYYPIKPIPDRKSLFDVLKDGILTEGTWGRPDRA
jgi:hypothetical protein